MFTFVASVKTMFSPTTHSIGVSVALFFENLLEVIIVVSCVSNAIMEITSDILSTLHMVKRYSNKDVVENMSYRNWITFVSLVYNKNSRSTG